MVLASDPGAQGKYPPGFIHRDTYNYQWAEQQRGLSLAEQGFLEGQRKAGNTAALPPWLQQLIRQNSQWVQNANGSYSPPSGYIGGAIGQANPVLPNIPGQNNPGQNSEPTAKLAQYILRGTF